MFASFPFRFTHSSLCCHCSYRATCVYLFPFSSSSSVIIIYLHPRVCKCRQKRFTFGVFHRSSSSSLVFSLLVACLLIPIGGWMWVNVCRRACLQHISHHPLLFNHPLLLFLHSSVGAVFASLCYFYLLRDSHSHIL